MSGNRRLSDSCQPTKLKLYRKDLEEFYGARTALFLMVNNH
jgi:hypothetical protein